MLSCSVHKGEPCAVVIFNHLFDFPFYDIELVISGWEFQGSGESPDCVEMIRHN